MAVDGALVQLQYACAYSLHEDSVMRHQYQSGLVLCQSFLHPSDGLRSGAGVNRGVCLKDALVRRQSADAYLG